MVVPSFLELNTVVCRATEDLTGSDDIVGILGGQRIAIGRFAGPERREVNISRAIVAGVTTLRIIEVDDFDPDDVLGTIQLTQDLDQNRMERLRAGRADYEFHFRVLSQT
jgi:hypothetical protein